MEEGIERGLSDRKNKKEEQFVKTDKKRRVFFYILWNNIKKKRLSPLLFFVIFILYNYIRKRVNIILIIHRIPILFPPVTFPL